MTTITTRSGKGSPLTNNEVDANFTNLNDDKVEASGDSMTGNLSFGDSNKAIFGAGSDLQIYHDGSHSRLKEVGTGSFYFDVSNSLFIRRNDTSAIMASFETGVAKLYFDNSAKLATTSTGIDVTGTAVTDGVTVAGNILLQNEGNELQFNTSSTPVNKIYSDDTYTSNGLTISADNGVALKSTNNYLVLDDTGTNEMVLNVDSGERMRVTATGIDVTGKVEADTAHINSSSSGQTANGLADDLVVETSGDTGISILSGATSDGRIFFGDSGSQYAGFIKYDHATNEFGFGTNGGASEKVTIDSSGNLDVTGTVTADGLAVDGNVVLGGPGDEVLVATNANLAPFYIARGYVTTETLAIGVDDSDAIINSIQDERYGGYKFQSTYSGTGTRTRMQIGQNTGDISFYDDAGTSPAFYWDASTSRLGLGTTSPDALMQIGAGARTANSSTFAATLLVGDRPNGDGVASIDFSPNLTTGNGVQISVDSSKNINFSDVSSGVYTSRLKIDSSGNLLVGKSSTGISTVGHELGATGYAYHTRDGGSVLDLNRKTSDGNIVKFYKDGTTVGSIGTGAGAFFIGGGDTNLTFNPAGDNIYPSVSGSTSVRDAAVDLGTSSARFKDLYLSGGAYLGGTASANHLDDYETGNFDPQVTTSNSDMSGITYVSQIGSYVKVGDLVWFRLQVGFSATTIGTGNFRITDLPFVSKNDSEARQAAQVLTFNLTWDSTWRQIASEGVQNSASTDFLISRSGSTWANLKATDMSNSTTYYYIVSGCYQTA